MWISKRDAEEYKAYQEIMERIEKEHIIQTENMVCLSFAAWSDVKSRLSDLDRVDHEIRMTTTNAEEAAKIARQEAEEWKHKYADEFQKRMALLDRMIKDNADE